MANSIRTDRKHDALFAIAIILVVAVKIYTLASTGFDRLGDFWRLEAFADQILASSSWLYDAATDRYALPPPLWKTPGYPLMMAAAKLAVGDAWPWPLMILQCAVSLAAGFFVRRLALDIGLGSLGAIAAFLLYEFSVPASTDTVLMPDALYGSMITMALCAVGSRILSSRPPGTEYMAGIGCVILLCFFIREGFIYLVVPIALALVAPAWLCGLANRRTATLMILAVCLPTFIAASMVLVWNRYRAGEYMIAIITQTVYMTATLKMAEKDPAVFNGNTLLDRVARESFQDYDYGDAQRIDERLFKEHGIKAPELARLAQRKFVETVVHHPRAYLLTILDRFRFRQQASMIGDVFMRLDDLDYWRNVNNIANYYTGWRAETQRFLDTRDFRLLNANVIANVAPRVIARTLSMIMFLMFVFVLPIVALRQYWSARDPEERRRPALIGTMWLLYWGILAIYLIVHMEIRYLSLICSIPIFGSLYVIAPYYSRMRWPRQRKARTSPA